jgi:tetraacyldisaccharide 4'-kinase
LRQTRVPIPVVSVGNITAGGTGKTPVTEALVRQVLPYRRVAILSRGYRSLAEKQSRPTVVSQGQGPLVGPKEAGDEAYALAKKLPEAIIITGRRRIDSANLAIDLGAELIVLDDGMQHLALARDLDIAVVSARQGVASRPYLPRGILRDSPWALKDVRLGMLTKIPNQARADSCHRAWAKYSQAPLVECQFVQTESLKGFKVAAFCGLGDPEDFFESVEAAGAQICERLTLADHRAPKGWAWQDFQLRALEARADFFLCSFKDWVKLDAQLPLPVKYLDIQMQIVSGHPAWEDCIREIRKL